MSEKHSACAVCGAEGTDLFYRVPSVPFVVSKITNRADQEKPGNIVKEFIQETKEDIKEYKKSLKEGEEYG
tara:strand:- start:1388 stop:1600 length:213 start_codon:yes stop_codon:yes gene_type:complete